MTLLECSCPLPLEDGPGTCERCMWRDAQVAEFFAAHPGLLPRADVKPDAPTAPVPGDPAGYTCGAGPY